MIGLFIGSFNPPTLAHLNICLKLEKEFQKIIFIPVNTKEKNVISMYHRINMLKIYKKKYPFLEIDNIMENYSYFNYRILDLLQKKYKNVKIIIGSDILNKLDNFDHKEYLLGKYHFIVIPRDGNTINIINTKYASYKNNFDICECNFKISSTKARELLKDKKNTDGILDMDIQLYIKKNHLYF